jgi:hypothetical protein
MAKVRLGRTKPRTVWSRSASAGSSQLVAASPSVTSTSAATDRCSRGESPAPAAMPPIRAPVSVPRLQSPWSPASSGRP